MTNEETNSPEVNAELPSAIEAASHRTDSLYPVEEQIDQPLLLRREARANKKAEAAAAARRALLFAPRPSDRVAPPPPPAGQPFPGETVIGPDRSNLGSNQISKETLEAMLNDLSGEMQETVELMQNEKRLDGERVRELTDLRQRRDELQAELMEIREKLDDMESLGTVIQEVFDRAVRHEQSVVELGTVLHRFLCDYFARKEGAANFSDLHTSLKDVVLWRISKLNFFAITSGRWAKLYKVINPTRKDIDASIDRIDAAGEQLEQILTKFSE